MGLKRKQSEGLSSLSIYGGDEEDNEGLDEEEIRVAMSVVPEESEIENNTDDVAELQETPQSEKNTHLLRNFLPPPPESKPSEKVQRDISKILGLKKARRSFNSEFRQMRDYQNPDFLSRIVSYLDIDQIGSCFSRDVFNPHGYDSSDYFDQIEINMKYDRVKKDNKVPKLESFSGVSWPAIMTITKRRN